MATYITVRGTNGAGKTSLLRKLVLTAACYRVETTLCQTKPDGSPRGKPFPVTILSNGVAIMGDYSPEAADKTTAGCDRISTQEDMRRILRHIGTMHGVRYVLFEGIIVSTLFSKWLNFSLELKAAGSPFIWAFLDTPLSVCLERVQARNGGKEVKEDQIADKHRSISRVMDKVRATAGEKVVVLDYNDPLTALQELCQ